MSKFVAFSFGTLLIASIACTFNIPSSGGLPPVTGSGDVVTITPELADFDQVDISHAFKATITQGDGYEVTIRIDDNLAEYLEARVSGRTLVVGLSRSIGFDFGATTLEVDITMPELTGLEASGASRASLSGFDSREDLRLDASGASFIGGTIDSGDMDIVISGASTVDLTGSGGNLDLEVSGASTAQLDAFRAEDARVEVSGASRARVYVSGTLDVEASGASHVTYSGNPSLRTINTSGASTISAE